MTTGAGVALVGTTHGYGTIGAGVVLAGDTAGTTHGDGTVGAVVLAGVAALAGAGPVATDGVVALAILTGATEDLDMDGVVIMAEAIIEASIEGITTEDMLITEVEEDIPTM